MEVYVLIAGLILSRSSAVYGASHDLIDVTTTPRVHMTNSNNITTTAPNCHEEINGTWVELDLKHRLLAKDCSGTSIPMGVGSGVFIFCIVMIVVTRLMKRETDKHDKIAFSKSLDIEAVSPLPSRCTSLLLLPQEILMDPLEGKTLQQSYYTSDETSGGKVSEVIVDSKLVSMDDHELTNGNDRRHTEKV